MKLLVCVPLMLATATFADEAADRAAIGKTMSALNLVPAPADIFTANADISALRRLSKDVAHPTFRVLSTTAAPTIQISHEPWGEATIGYPRAVLELVNPRLEMRALRFLTSEAATVDAVWVERENGQLRYATRLLVNLRKEGSDWKIASVTLAPPRV